MTTLNNVTKIKECLQKETVSINNHTKNKSPLQHRHTAFLNIINSPGDQTDRIKRKQLTGKILATIIKISCKKIFCRKKRHGVKFEPDSNLTCGRVVIQGGSITAMARELEEFRSATVRRAVRSYRLK